MPLILTLQEDRLLDNGKTVVFRDSTTGYGLDGNPLRSQLALYVELHKRNPDGSYRVEPGVSYLLDGVASTEVFANEVSISMPTPGVYKIVASLLPLISSIDPILGELAVGTIVFDEATDWPGRIALYDEYSTGLYTYSTLPLLTVEHEEVTASTVLYKVPLRSFEENYTRRVFKYFDMETRPCELQDEVFHDVQVYGLELEGLKSAVDRKYWDRAIRIIQSMEYKDKNFKDFKVI